MNPSKFSRMPRHVGLIPDGNRRWARERGRESFEGYAAGMEVGLRMLDDCLELGISEVSVYGFTMDNNKRPREQRLAFGAACVAFVEEAMKRPIHLRVIGDHTSAMFPPELTEYAVERRGCATGLKVNMLVNYGWNWDIQTAVQAAAKGDRRPFPELLASNDVSRVDLLVRWGGMRRLSGFLPMQCAYADFFVVDALWPDYELSQFHEALDWYQRQDVTLGG